MNVEERIQAIAELRALLALKTALFNPISQELSALIEAKLKALIESL